MKIHFTCFTHFYTPTQITEPSRPAFHFQFRKTYYFPMRKKKKAQTCTRFVFLTQRSQTFSCPKVAFTLTTSFRYFCWHLIKPFNGLWQTFNREYHDAWKKKVSQRQKFNKWSRNAIACATWQTLHSYLTRSLLHSGASSQTSEGKKKHKPYATLQWPKPRTEQAHLHF